MGWVYDTWGLCTKWEARALSRALLRELGDDSVALTPSGATWVDAGELASVISPD